MGFPLIAYGNQADIAIYSGGSWQDKLPLTNLGQRQMGRLARTTSTANAATQFTVDIGIDQLTRVFAILNHNLHTGAKFRLTATFNDPLFTNIKYDSGWTPVWPSVYSFDQVEWESDNFWFGTYKVREITGYPWHLIILLDTSLNLRYWKFEIDDVGNPDGYIQAGRLFIGDGWQPLNGIPYGASIGFEDPTIIDESLSGSEYFDPKHIYRVARITTHFMDDAEAFSKAYEVQRQSGTGKEVIYVHDTDDTINAIRRRFAGRLRVLGPIENPYPSAHQAAWEIKEALP